MARCGLNAYLPSLIDEELPEPDTEPDPFDAFDEWNGPADDEAYRDL